MDSALGLIRAHDQASVDQFLAFAEKERSRLEHLVADAERQCAEAQAAYETAAHHNRQVASELFGAWQELQAEREHAALTVNERLQAARSEAEQRIEAFRAGGQIPVEHLEETVAHMVAPAVAQGWAAAPADAASTPEAETELPLPPWSEPMEPEGPPTRTAAAAAPVPATTSRRFALPPTLQVPQVAAASVAHAAPLASVATVVAAPATQAGSAEAEHQQFQEFWTADGSMHPPPQSQREGLITALLPMLALVIVLVVVLAWIG